jgi:hypothetical protein
MGFLWDLWVTISSPSEIIHLSTEKVRALGNLIHNAMSTLPPSFCGTIRDPYLKRQSQYKIYEWMALLHWYIIPIGIELEFNPAVLENFSFFAEAVERAMTIQPMGQKELADLMGLIKNFLMGFEQIYVGDNPEYVSHCRLCIFQLIHVAQHITWNGSICIGSQATVERENGEFGHQDYSKKAPFAHLANIIYEKQLVHTLLLSYPSLAPPASPLSKASKNLASLHQEIRMTKQERSSGADLASQLRSIHAWLGFDTGSDVSLQRYGKAYLASGTTVRSRLSESHGPAGRSSRYFEAAVDGTNTQPIVGEALAFFQITNTQQLIVAYHPLVHMQQVLK